MRTVARTAASAVATIVIAATTVLTGATGAQAHDALVASSPAPGSHLDAAPSTVSLTFSADVLEIGAAIIVADTAGGDWVADPVAVTRDTVTATLTPDMPDGTYQVRWRIVSADGHPISDVFAFSVGEVRASASPGEADVAPGESSTSVPTDQGTPDGGAVLVILLGVAAAATAAAAYVIIRFILSRRARRGGPGSTPA